MTILNLRVFRGRGIPDDIICVDHWDYSVFRVTTTWGLPGMRPVNADYSLASTMEYILTVLRLFRDHPDPKPVIEARFSTGLYFVIHGTEYDISVRVFEVLLRKRLEEAEERTRTLVVDRSNMSVWIRPDLRDFVDRLLALDPARFQQ